MIENNKNNDERIKRNPQETFFNLVKLDSSNKFESILFNQS